MPRARANALLLVICNVPDIRVSSCKMVCQFVSKANEMVHGRGTVDVNRRYHQLRPREHPSPGFVSVMAIYRQQCHHTSVGPALRLKTLPIQSCITVVALSNRAVTEGKRLRIFDSSR